MKAQRINLKHKFKYLRATLVVCFSYAIFGSLWIYFSDSILSLLIKDTEKYAKFSTFKGWFFILVTSLILFLMTNAFNRSLRKNEERIRENLDITKELNNELENTNQELVNSLVELRKKQSELEDSDEKFKMVIQGYNDCIWDWNLKTGAFWFPKTRALLGYTIDSMVDTVESFESLVHPDDWTNINKARLDFIKGKNTTYDSELRLLDSEGKYRWIFSRGQAIFDKDGSISRIIGYHSDISERKKKEEEIHNIAYFDFLTKLLNKFGFNEELKQILSDKPRMIIGLLLLDIDNFKTINDSFGHEFGDLILVEISKRLQKLTNEKTIIGRTGGDKFEIIYLDIAGINDMQNYVIHLSEMFLIPFLVKGREIYISPSIGVSIYPFDGKTANDISKCTEIAMYKAKETEKNGYQFFREEMREEIIRKAEIELNLRKAIDQDEFELYFQPVIDLKKGNVFAFEALIRWKNQGKTISPMDFIPLAEDTGLIIQIGEIVIEKACIALEELNLSGYDKIRIGVNFSVKQFGNGRLFDYVINAIDKRKIKRENFIIEVTESIALQDRTSRIDMLKAFDDAGIAVTLDDFGTGYSSLSYLKELPISCVKIDKSFTKDVVDSEDDKAILSAINSISKTFRYLMLAEGVETFEQLKVIKDLGCRFAQGYLFSTPLPFNEALKYLASEETKKSIQEITIPIL